MAEPLRKSEEFQENSEGARETEPGRKSSLGEEIRARIPHLHKGAVGRPGTNEDVFQGSKGRELG